MRRTIRHVPVCDADEMTTLGYPVYNLVSQYGYVSFVNMICMPASPVSIIHMPTCIDLKLVRSMK